MSNIDRKLRTSLLTNQKLYGGMFPPFYNDIGNLKVVYDSNAGILHTAYLIQLAFLDCSSENPFERLGINQNLIFSQNSPVSVEAIKVNIIEVLKQFSDRLDVISISVTPAPQEGYILVDLEIMYKPLKRKILLSKLVVGGINA